MTKRKLKTKQLLAFKHILRKECKSLVKRNFDHPSRYNAEVSNKRPFHLTMTLFWITIIRNAMMKYGYIATSTTTTIMEKVPAQKQFDHFCKTCTELTDSKLYLQYLYVLYWHLYLWLIDAHVYTTHQKYFSQNKQGQLGLSLI